MIKAISKPSIMFLITLSLLVFFRSTQSSVRSEADKLTWLEDLDGKESMSWVHIQNQRVESTIFTSPLMKDNEQESLSILKGNSELVSGTIVGDYVYSSMPSAVSNQGAWKRIKFFDYVHSQGKWEQVLDVDALNAETGKEYKLMKANCLRPKFERCLIDFSNAGADYVDVREYDVNAKAFVKDGFHREKTNLSFSWIDSNTILSESKYRNGFIDSNFFPDNLSLWKRRSPLKENDKGLSWRQSSLKNLIADYDENEVLRIVYNASASPNIIKQEILTGTRELRTLSLPIGFKVMGFLENKAIMFKVDSNDAPYYGDVYSADIDSLGQKVLKIEKIYKNEEKNLIGDLSVIKNNVLIKITKNIKNRIVRLYWSNGWQVRAFPFEKIGTIEFIDDHDSDDAFRFTFEDPLTPKTIFAFDANSETLTTIRVNHPTFKSSNIHVEQKFAASKDGTKIPYFLIGNKATKLDGKNPTILMGYGGFGISMIPVYMSITGKLWLERGGVFAFSNIRGGGEFGDKWHFEAMRERKQNSFDDFIAIAEDLINQGITSPEHLGIKGGSNGGLLVGAAFTQKPELFNAVVCQSPILDMKRFMKLGGRGNLIDEYGNPDDPKDAEYLLKYSPLHNLSAAKKYPDILFITSHNDDRVHPAHARKMAEKLREMGKSFLYYEGRSGGHFNGTLEWTAKTSALELTFFAERLGPFPAH